MNPKTLPPPHTDIKTPSTHANTHAFNLSNQEGDSLTFVRTQAGWNHLWHTSQVISVRKRAVPAGSWHKQCKASSSSSASSALSINVLCPWPLAAPPLMPCSAVLATQRYSEESAPIHRKGKVGHCLRLRVAILCKRGRLHHQHASDRVTPG